MDQSKTKFERIPKKTLQKFGFKDGGSFMIGGCVSVIAFAAFQFLNIPNPWNGILSFIVVLLVQLISKGCFNQLCATFNEDKNFKSHSVDPWNKFRMPNNDIIDDMAQAGDVIKLFKEMQQDIPEPDWILGKSPESSE